MGVFGGLFRSVANKRADSFERLLTDISVIYTRRTIDDDPVVSMSFGGGDFKFEHMDVHVIFDESGSAVHLSSSPILRVPESKVSSAVALCNEANTKDRWVKFYVDGDCDLMCDGDAIITDATCADVCREMTGRMLTIIDEHYLAFMKVV